MRKPQTQRQKHQLPPKRPHLIHALNAAEKAVGVVQTGEALDPQHTGPFDAQVRTGNRQYGLASAMLQHHPHPAQISLFKAVLQHEKRA